MAEVAVPIYLGVFAWEHTPVSIYYRNLLVSQRVIPHYATVKQQALPCIT